MDNTKAMMKADMGEERTIESIMSLVETMKEQLDSMERFVSRRFDELSMEINATSQQLDMAEEGLTGRFSEILNALAAINFRGDGETAANTGVELEAVIKTTEDAATQIMDAAERISHRIGSDKTLTGDVARQKFLEETRNDVESILLACSFQDLTGQRIRKILESIQTIEDHISTTLGKLGVDITPDAMEGGIRESVENHSASQGDIDALFD
ncbi:MAG: protein phosphatase CheZ [Alphaproteobacteria bacterium]|nr:protein phosphatase CheZ [Alphaproteobacteria bacterium]